MAKSLRSLIRLNEWEVDQRRRKLGALLQSLNSLETAVDDLAAELVREQEQAGQSPAEGGFLYGNYAFAVIARRESLEDAIAEMEVRIAAAREELGEAYRELKKFEVAQEVRDTREAQELAREEQAILDELGLQTYRARS